MNRNELAKLAISLFIAIIFIVSYAAFGSNALPSSQQATTTVKPPQQTVYATSDVNGTVVGYGQVFSVLVGCNAALAPAAAYNITALLTNLESNNSVYNYYSPNESTFSVLVGKMDAYQSSEYVSSHLSNATNACVSFNGQDFVALPQSANFTVSTQQGIQHIPVLLPAPNRNITIQAALYSNGSKIPLRVAALLTQNGTVYSMNVTSRGGK